MLKVASPAELCHYCNLISPNFANIKSLSNSHVLTTKSPREGISRQHWRHRILFRLQAERATEPSLGPATLQSAESFGGRQSSRVGRLKEGAAEALSRGVRSAETGVQRGLGVLQKGSLDFSKVSGDAFRNRCHVKRPHDGGRCFAESRRPAIIFGDGQCLAGPHLPRSSAASNPAFTAFSAAFGKAPTRFVNFDRSSVVT